MSDCILTLTNYLDSIDNKLLCYHHIDDDNFNCLTYLNEPLETQIICNYC